jgi:cell fate regulator YaaT (PSP1 superfamily)
LKISGACGRLLCCLSYEYGFYKEARSKLPNNGEKILYNKAEYFVSDVNIFKKRIVLSRTNEENAHIDFSRIFRNEKTNKWEIADPLPQPKDANAKSDA